MTTHPADHDHDSRDPDIRWRDHVASILSGMSYAWLFVTVILSLPGLWLDRFGEHIRNGGNT